MSNNPWLSVTSQLAATPPAPPDTARVYCLVASVAGVPAGFTDNARIYTTLTAMASDGFTSSHPVYNAAEDLFNNTASPTESPVRRIVVAKRAAPVASVWTIDVDATADGAMTITDADGTIVASFTASTSTATDIRDGLIASAASGYTAAIGDTDTLTITRDVAGVPMTLTIGGAAAANLSGSETTPHTGIYADLDAAHALYKFWGVLPVGEETEEVLDEARRWCEADVTNRRNFLFAQQVDTGLADSGDSDNLALTWVAAERKRCALLTHPTATEYMWAAAIGKVGGAFPGSRAWHYLPVGGSVETTLTPTRTDSQLSTLKTRKVSYTARFDGPTSQMRIYGGFLPNGNYIVQVHAEDWWWYTVRAAVDAALASNEGVDLDDEGLDKVRSEIQTATLPLVLNGVLEDDFTVTYTPLADIPAGELATGDFQTTGKITVSGRLTPKLRSLAVNAEFAVA